MAGTTGGSIKNVGLTETMKVAAALTGGKIVKLTANENEINLCTATTDKAIGVTIEDQATIGEGCAFQYAGEVWVTSGAAVNIGDDITPDASGRGVAAGAGVGVQMQVVGRALSAVNGANKEFRMLIGFFIKNNAVN